MPMSLKNFREKMKDPAFVKAGVERCSKCGVPLHEGSRKSPNGRVCEECYFFILGKGMGQMMMPRPVRGT